MMPGVMNGLALAKALRETMPELPVLLVTGFSQAIVETTQEFAVLRKPFELADLGRAARRLIASARSAKPALPEGDTSG